jgi:WD40 repeat protein
MGIRSRVVVTMESLPLVSCPSTPSSRSGDGFAFTDIMLTWSLLCILSVNVKTGHIESLRGKHANIAGGIAFLASKPDTLISTSYDSTIKVWTAAGGSLLDTKRLGKYLHLFLLPLSLFHSDRARSSPFICCS